MQLVIPMAGLGQRFVDAGFALPKPLIPVDGTPMVLRVVRELPAAERQVFVVHLDHVRDHKIDELLARQFSDCRVVITPGLTQGQACTVRLACDQLDPLEPVLVAACDNSHLYDCEEFERLTSSGDWDCLIWTYRRDFRVLAKPTAHGWVQLRPDSSAVEKVSCKQPISSQPLQDHAISGCFWFRSASILQAGIDALIASGQTVNGEYYLDVAPNLLLRAGYRVRVFEVNKYIGWGTPDDLADFELWQRYFSGRGELVGS